jgi:hypothetical protein
LNNWKGIYFYMLCILRYIPLTASETLHYSNKV